MPGLQEWLHELEVGTGAKYIKIAAGALILLTLVLLYNFWAFRNMSTQEAMDAAQVARNLAEGRGFTTWFIRPLSIHLVEESSGQAAAPLVPGTARLKDNHPDLANAPVYPAVLAGLMKVLPFDYDTTTKNSLFNRDGKFWWYEPDFLISLFNEGLFLLAVWLTFLLARKLFDPAVAWLTAALMLGTEVLWHFAVSGLSTMLLIVIFLGLCWCLVALEQGARENSRSAGGIILLAAVSGVILGLGGMTRYSFGWLIIPVVVFLILFTGSNGVRNGIAALLAFLLVMTPWVVRNVKLSGLPFGTATLAVMEETSPKLSHTKLERSLSPDLSDATFRGYLDKFNINIRTLVSGELPTFAGSWVTAFFLVGLLVSFINPAPGRLRYFLVGCLLVFCVVQALGKTHLSDDSPGINTENLLVILAPLVLMFGASLFLILLERMALPFPELRAVVIGLFVAMSSLPLLLMFPPPHVRAIAYPPYYPPIIQHVGSLMKPDEMIMSDVPWAVAWYGQRQCIWLTMDAQASFYAINDYQKQIRAVYLTPETLDARFLTDWIRSDELSWGSFVIETIMRKQVPPGFPLQEAPDGYLPEQFFLTDRRRDAPAK